MDEINDIEYTSTNNEVPKVSVVKKPSLKQISILYSLSILLFAFLGSRAQKNEFTTGILITEFILILLPPLILLVICKYDIRKVLRLNRLGILNAVLIILIMACALPVVGVFNFANLTLIKVLFGKIIVAQPPLLTGPYSLILNILLIAGTAGLCEEVLYRGVIQRGFERLGTVKAILAAAFLFSLAHLDFQKLLGIFMLGSIIGFIVYRTNSLYGGMLAHFTNNAIAVIFAFFGEILKKFNNNIDKVGVNADQNLDPITALMNMPKAQLIVGIVIALMFVLACTACLVGLVIWLIKNTGENIETKEAEIEGVNYKYLLWIVPGIVMIAFVYFAEGLKLRGISIEGINIVLEVIGLK